MIGKNRQDDVVTLVAVGSTLYGSLSFAHQLYVNGRIEGDVESVGDDDARIVISATGSVVGDISVPNVVIHGRVEGNVQAAKRVELGAQAAVRGDVCYRLMEMQLGAVVEGQLLHHDTVVPRVDTEISLIDAEDDVSLPFRVADRSAGRTA